MNYNNFSFFLFLRILILLLFLSILAFAITSSEKYLILGAGILCLFSFLNLRKFVVRRFKEIDDFFESVKYGDFSRKFVESSGPKDIRHLHKGFNQVNKVVRDINVKKEVQYLYLQKILELVNIGLIAYNLKTGEVLWTNESVRTILDLPSFKYVKFIASRKPELFKKIFENRYSEPTSINLSINNTKSKILVSDTIFQMEKESFKLIIIQNIEDTLNQNESEAWKKLLSVMTHEIMNSIAPISSLAETLHNQVKYHLNNSQTNLEIEDLDAGLASIKKRSQGLMKFARTYRSLNKITHLNLENVSVKDLFKNIQHLLAPSISNKNIDIEFRIEPPNLEINIDTYLIEQVLINLIINAVDACKGIPDGRVVVSAKRDLHQNTILKIKDNGSGIPEEIRENIFVPFFTTKKNGSGIGLSLSKQIIMLHKGKIQINSKEKIGTIVSLSI